MERELTGVGEYAFNLLKSVFEQDCENQYFLFYNSRQEISFAGTKFDYPNVHYCDFHYPNKLLNSSLILFNRPRLDLLIEKKIKQKVDLFFFPNLAFFSVKCPYLITCHDLSFQLFPEFLSWQRRIWHYLVRPAQKFSAAQKVIAVSQNTQNDLTSNYQLPITNVGFFYSGIDEIYRPIDKGDINLQKIKIKYALPDQFILFLSTVEPRKNLETLVDAFESLEDENNNFHLVIAGKVGWKSEKILKRIEQNKKIKLLNFVEMEDKHYLYNLAKMLVFPSHYEGFGFPPLEAMACGVPVICANNSSLSEVCGSAAILIDSHNAADLKEAIVALNDAQTADYFREKGLSQVKQFSWQKAGREFLMIMNLTKRLT